MPRLRFDSGPVKMNTAFAFPLKQCEIEADNVPQPGVENHPKPYNHFNHTTVKLTCYPGIHMEPLGSRPNLPGPVTMAQRSLIATRLGTASAPSYQEVLTFSTALRPACPETARCHILQRRNPHWQWRHVKIRNSWYYWFFSQHIGILALHFCHWY